MPQPRKVDPDIKAEITKRVLNRELSYRQAAKLAGVSNSMIWKWVHQKDGETPKPVGRPLKLSGVSAGLRARIVQHILRGEITISEGALIANRHYSTVASWLEGLSSTRARDEYLRRLFPDLLGEPRTTAPAREKPRVPTPNQ